MVTMAVTLPTAFLVVLIEYGTGDLEATSTPAPSLLSLVFGMILFSPLVETALIVLIHNMTRARLGLTGFVAINTVFWAIAHIPLQNVPIAVAMLFIVMSYQYVSFRETIGARRAFWGVCVTHALNNGIAGTTVVLAQRLNL